MDGITILEHLTFAVKVENGNSKTERLGDKLRRCWNSKVTFKGTATKALDDRNEASKFHNKPVTKDDGRTVTNDGLYRRNKTMAGCSSCILKTKKNFMFLCKMNWLNLPSVYKQSCDCSVELVRESTISKRKHSTCFLQTVHLLGFANKNSHDNTFYHSDRFAKHETIITGK